ncbi:MAG: HipA domain-containing protein [Planctomycetota bacterium]|jgi:hypothetical protein
MGTKPKFWFFNKELGWSLFKECRHGTGEDWAEKIAAELADLLGLPHARYELATCGKNHGIVTPLFRPSNSTMIHGNELLPQLVAGYPKSKNGIKEFYHLSQYTIGTVLNVINNLHADTPLNWTPLTGITTPMDVFVGYLMLDAWIGNTDRHHENWAYILIHYNPNNYSALWHLAPTYDHASSLGRNETDENRLVRLTTKDMGHSIEAYVKKARSAFYYQKDNKKPITTHEAFQKAAKSNPGSADIWLKRLENVSLNDILTILKKIPKQRISTPAIEFAQKMLQLNRDILSKTRKELH